MATTTTIDDDSNDNSNTVVAVLQLQKTTRTHKEANTKKCSLMSRKQKAVHFREVSERKSKFSLFFTAAV